MKAPYDRGLTPPEPDDWEDDALDARRAEDAADDALLRDL